MGLLASVLGVFSKRRGAAEALGDEGADALERELRLGVERLAGALHDTVRASAEATSLYNRLDAALSKTRREAGAWQERARAALLAADESKAREAIATRRRLEAEAAAMSPSVDAARRASERLRLRVAEMRTRIATAERESATLLARRNAVRAQARLGAAIVDVDDDAFAALASFEAAAEREASVSAGGGDGAGAAGSADGAGVSSAEIEAELDVLRREIGGA